MLPRASYRHESMDFSGSVFLISADGSVLSLPVPSDLSRDPLNWSMWKRARAGLALLSLSVIGLVLIEGPSLMLKDLAIEFTFEDTQPFDITILLSAPTLFMGIGAFVWIPLSIAIGRRPVILFGLIIILLATLWAGITRNFYQLLLAICLQGLVTGLGPSAMLLMVIDLTFIHQRPQFISLFWCLEGFFCLIFLTIMPMVPPFVIFGHRWRSFYFFWCIPIVAVLVIAFFWVEETYFVRPAIAFDGRILVHSATEKIKFYNRWEEVPGGKPLPDQPDETWQKMIWKKLRLWGARAGGWRAAVACYPQILQCIFNPLILCVTILNAVAFAGMLSIGMTYATLLKAAPYNLSMKIIALVNLAASFGSLLAWPATGMLISKLSRHLSMRNRGVCNAEYYLPAYILPVLAGTISNVLYGYTAEYKWHFFYVYIAYFFNSFTYTSLGIANTLWVTEAFPRWAASALVLVGGASYMTSFGMTFVILPWIKSQGFLGENLELGVLILLVGSLLIPVSFWGRSLRHYINRKWAPYEVGALRPR